MKKQILAIVSGLLFVPTIMLASLNYASAATPKILYVNFNGVDTMDIHSISPDTTGDANLTNGSGVSNGLFGAEWSPDGTKIAYVRSSGGGTPFNVYVMDANGSNTTQLTSTDYSGIYGISWSPDSSKLAYTRSEDGGSTFNIYSINTDGTGDTQLTNSGIDVCPTWSPANNKIAFVSNRDGNPEIYTMNTDGSSETNITNDTGTDGYFSISSPFCSLDISPDGTSIAFSSDRDDVGVSYELYSAAIDGSGLSQLTSNGGGTRNVMPNFSHDGSKILFGSDRDDPSNGPDAFAIYSMNADGSSETALTTSGQGDVFPTNSMFGQLSWSPDDSQIAFTTVRGGETLEVYTMNSDGTSQTLLATDFSFKPDWQPVVTENSGGEDTTDSNKSSSLADTGEAQLPLELAAGLLITVGIIGTLNIRRKASLQ